MPIARPIRASARERYYRYAGAVHVHSTYSDGSGRFDEIAASARAIGLDFLVMTDHETLAPLRDGRQGYQGSLLVLVGAELSTTAGHLLALDLPATFQGDTREPQALIDHINRSGGFSILAHPTAAKGRWQDWQVEGFAGIEVINLASLADERLRLRSPIRLGQRCLFRMLGMFIHHRWNPCCCARWITRAAPSSGLDLWDRLVSEKGEMAGIASGDAHARIRIGKLSYRAPSYSSVFATMQTHVVLREPLTGDAEVDRSLVYDALRNGQAYIVYPQTAPARGFSFVAQEAHAETTMGGVLPLECQARLIVEAPDHPSPSIRVLRNGEEIALTRGNRLVLPVSRKGAYRAEVYASATGRVMGRGLRPWIFTNPIHLR